MKIKYFFTVVLLTLIVACNSDKPGKQNGKNESDGHSGHGMMTASRNYCDSVNSGLIPEDTLKGSPHRTAMQTINGTHVHIEYGSPGVKGRIIWGGLVAYNKVWVTGAHNATSIQFKKDVEIGGKRVPAGIYAFFTIPGKEVWTVIINKNYEQHLSDEYTEQDDVLRLQVKPEEHDMTQRLTYTVNKIDENSGVVTMLWERIHIHIPFKTI